MTITLPTTAAAIGRLIGAQVIGDETLPVNRLASISSLAEGTLGYVADAQYLSELRRACKAVVLTEEKLVDRSLSVTFLVVPDPQGAFARIAKSIKAPAPWKGISPRAVIHPTAKVAVGVSIGPDAILAEGVEIGEGTTIYPRAYVGPNVRIGRQCEVFPNATLLDGVVVGDRVRIFPGAVLGADGFRLIPNSDGTLTEVAHLGTVIVEDDVRIGANCTIARGTLGETKIGLGTKLDDQVHVGHNVTIGKNCTLCAQVGIAGSAVVEDSVVLGGQAGVSDHVTVGKGAQIGGKTAVLFDVVGNEKYFLTPAIPMKEALKIVALWKKLPELWQRVKRLESKSEVRS